MGEGALIVGHQLARRCAVEGGGEPVEELRLGLTEFVELVSKLVE
jgi:hypothetical protein